MHTATFERRLRALREFVQPSSATSWAKTERQTDRRSPVLEAQACLARDSTQRTGPCGLVCLGALLVVHGTPPSFAMIVVRERNTLRRCDPDRQLGRHHAAGHT